MREQIITLIASAEEVVANFEKDVFINDRGFYMNAKSLIDDMIEQIVLIKETTELEDYTEEIYNANKEDLTFIIDTINQLSELVKTKKIQVIIEGKGNYRVKVTGEKEIKINMDENNMIETELSEVEEIQPTEIHEEPLSEADIMLDESAIDNFLNNNE